MRHSTMSTIAGSLPSGRNADLVLQSSHSASEVAAEGKALGSRGVVEVLMLELLVVAEGSVGYLMGDSS